MTKETHPLTRHLKERGESLTDFARRLNMSRMQLYRIMNGESTTTDTLKKISEATGGKVPASAFLENGRAA
jgi:transcriptional regulator with XRE-family HTH domain